MDWLLVLQPSVTLTLGITGTLLVRWPGGGRDPPSWVRDRPSAPAGSLRPDDESTLVTVKHLPRHYDDEALRCLCATYGTVVWYRVNMDPGIGDVYMATRAEARRRRGPEQYGAGGDAYDPGATGRGGGLSV